MLITALALLLVQTPVAQSYIARKVLSGLNSKSDGHISFVSMHLSPSKGLTIKGLVITDDNFRKDLGCDTLFRAENIYAKFSLKNLLSEQGIYISSARVSKGTLNLISDTDSLRTLNLLRVFGVTLSDDESKGGFKLFIRKAEATDIDLRIAGGSSKVFSGKGIDFTDLKLHASASGRNLSVKDGVFSIEVENAVAETDEGYTIRANGGEVAAGSGWLALNGIHAHDYWSEINLEHLYEEFTIKRLRAKRGIRDSLECSLPGSRIDLRTLESIMGLDMPGDGRALFEIASGSISGGLNNIIINNLHISEIDSWISATLNGNIRGLTSNDVFLNCAIKELVFEKKGLVSLAERFGINANTIGGILSDKGRFRFDGNAKGTLEHLETEGKLCYNTDGIKPLTNDYEASGGSMSANLTINNLGSKNAESHFSGRLETEDLDAGSIIGLEALGKCSLHGNFSATLSRRRGISGKIDSLKVDRLELLGYDYSNIHALGAFSGQDFDGRVVCNDPNLSFLFQGLFNLSRNTNNAKYNFFAYLGYADLHALKLDSRQISKASGASIRADYRRIRRGELDGSLELKGLKLEGKNTNFKLGDVILTSHSATKDYSLKLSSDFAHGEFRGTRPIAKIWNDLKHITIERELPSLLLSSGSSGNEYSLNLNMHDSRDLLSFVMPGLYIADSTFVRLKVKSDNSLNGHISSSRIAYGKKFIKGLDIRIDNLEGGLNCKMAGDRIFISDAFRLDNNSLILYARDDYFGIGYYFDNGGDNENRGEIYLTGNCMTDIHRHPIVKASSLTSNIYIEGKQWRILPGEFEYGEGRFRTDGFIMECDDQSLIVEGGIQSDKEDTLEVNISNIDLGMFSSLTTALPELQGRISGRARLLSPLDKRTGLLSRISVDDAYISGHKAGNISAGISWNGDDGVLNVVLRDSIDSLNTINARASYSPDNGMITAKLGLSGFEAGYFSSLTNTVFSRMEGKVYGNIELDGTLDKPSIQSEECRLESTVLQVAATGVTYNVEGGFHIDNSGIHFDNIAANDGRKGRAIVSGGVLYDRFKDFRLATSIKAQDIKCVDLDDGASFYGQLKGSGQIDIQGPFNAVRLEANAVTSSKGELHIPLGASATMGGNDLLKFTEAEKNVWIDPYDQMINKMSIEESSKSDFSMTLNIGITPDAECFVELDRESGNMLNGHGQGNIILDMRQSKNLFNIRGDYTLNSGNFHFSALGLAQRDFSINDGSTIKFNGDIMESDLDIDAVYSTKTSLSSLIADTTSVATRRNVNCGIKVAGKLRNPSLAFSINVPDVDPLTKSRVESALSTDDKIQRQFLALLITGSFIPDDQSGVVNTPSNILYSNVADLMANQLNNILERLDIPLDLGLGYQTSTGGSSIFDVAVSTQLFNNRVIMNGTIGNRQLANTTTGDVIGDIDIEIKLDRRGYLRLNLFSHSADAYTNYLDNSQRNGIGLAYQKEFNSAGEFLRSLFANKQKREAMEMETLANSMEKNTITIE